LQACRADEENWKTLAFGKFRLLANLFWPDRSQLLPSSCNAAASIVVGIQRGALVIQKVGRVELRGQRLKC